jgi:hypothetical protein
MKRVAELEEKAKRARQEADAAAKEADELRASNNFFKLLNVDLAEWQKRLRTRASPVEGKWKLVIYSHEDHSPLQYGRSTYSPPIFTEGKWLAEHWTAERYHDGRGAIIAYADDPRNLLADKISLMRLSLFYLPYLVCPSHVQHPTTLHKLYESSDHFDAFIYGTQRVFLETECNDDLKPIAGIQVPDLANPEHVAKIYKALIYRPYTSDVFKQEMAKLQELQAALKRKFKFYTQGIALKNEILE